VRHVSLGLFLFQVAGHTGRGAPANDPWPLLGRPDLGLRSNRLPDGCPTGCCQGAVQRELGWMQGFLEGELSSQKTSRIIATSAIFTDKDHRLVLRRVHNCGESANSKECRRADTAHRASCQTPQTRRSSNTNANTVNASKLSTTRSIACSNDATRNGSRSRNRNAPPPSHNRSTSDDCRENRYSAEWCSVRSCTCRKCDS
jgi:hypothetical protein